MYLYHVLLALAALSTRCWWLMYSAEEISSKARSPRGCSRCCEGIHGSRMGHWQRGFKCKYNSLCSALLLGCFSFMSDTFLMTMYCLNYCFCCIYSTIQWKVPYNLWSLCCTWWIIIIMNPFFSRVGDSQPWMENENKMRDRNAHWKGPHSHSLPLSNP